MKNKVLKLTVITIQALLTIHFLLAGFVVSLMILWLFDSVVFESIWMIDDSVVFKFETHPSQEGVSLNTYGSVHFYFICFKTIMMIFLSVLILRLSLKIIRSIKSIETFKSDNVLSFRSIGKYFLIWFIVDIPSLIQHENNLGLKAEIGLKYLVFALLCFVLAEIFSEGNQLMEENKLTI